MRIDYEAIADKAADSVADWNDTQEADSMWEWVHKDPARFDAWLEFATKRETDRLIEAEHEAQAEARQTAREWRDVA